MIVWALRHGQSTANAAFEQARATGEPLRVPGADAAIALTPLGRQQAFAAGDRFAADPAGAPELVITSTYLRARQTAAIVLGRLAASGRPGLELRLDQRLVDRRVGVLELMTPAAVALEYPQETARLAELGLVRHRPPGGETLWDVADRLRPFWKELPALGLDRVLVVAHDAVILMLRAITEDLTDADLLEIIEHNPVLNAGVARWASGADGRLRLTGWNDSGHR